MRIRTLLNAFLAAWLAVPLFAADPVTVSVVRPVAMSDHNTLHWTLIVWAPNGATDVPVTFMVVPGTMASVPAGCEIVNTTHGACTIDLQPGVPRTLEFTSRHTHTLGHFLGNALAGSFAATADAVFGAIFPVTNTNDSGAGSLRQAILDVNRLCTDPAGPPCVVDFALPAPVPAAGYYTIRPDSPLPQIIGLDVVIDGETQSRRTADTNPSGGPEIFLDGSQAGSGHGLSFSGFQLQVANLVIGNFPGNGIESRSTGATWVRRMWLGTDPSGVRAAANGLRGVQLEGGSAAVQDSVISGNKRAGVYINVLEGSTVTGNLIGIGADGVTPLGNGASGIYLDKRAVNFRHAAVANNTIGYNMHAGIAVTTNVIGDWAPNDFRFNAGLPIDANLDGPTTLLPGLPGQGGVVGVPRILSATYADGVTSIEVEPGALPGGTHVFTTVYVYLSGRDLLGSAQRDYLTNRYIVRVNRDLRGHEVTASNYKMIVYNWDDPAGGTSEMSGPTLVR